MQLGVLTDYRPAEFQRSQFSVCCGLFLPFQKTHAFLV